MTDLNAQVLLDAYRTAVYDRDVPALMALYDEQVHIFDLWETWEYAGAAAWQGAVMQWFSSLGDERVAVRWSDVQTHAGAEVAVLSALVTYQGESADGQALRAMQNRLTWALARRAEGWRIVHEHTSAPVSGETSRVILHP